MNKKTTFGAVFSLGILTLIGCGKKKNENCQYPSVSFYNSINLISVDFNKLNSDNNFVYYNSRSGLKGVIIYRYSATEYRVFERASPIDINNDKAILQMDGTGIFMTDTVHKQTWDMNGYPYSGASNCQVLKYSSVLNDPYLNIGN